MQSDQEIRPHSSAGSPSRAAIDGLGPHGDTLRPPAQSGKGAGAALPTPRQTTPPATLGAYQENEPGSPEPGATRSQPLKFGDLEDYWKYFDEEANRQDRDFVDGLKANLDNLLIFAGLFSAINSAFLALSIPGLSDEPTSGTNSLLALLIHTIDNTTSIPDNLIPAPFQARPVDIRINLLFSISLTLSLIASFGALLAQQFIVSYKRLTPKAEDDPRWDRERKYSGVKRWKLEGVMEAILPSLLQAALFVFMIGFVFFLHDLSVSVALPNLGLLVVGATCFGLSIIIALLDPFCPCQTPLIIIARSLIHSSILTIRNGTKRLFCRLRWHAAASWIVAHEPSLGSLIKAVQTLQVEFVKRTLANSGDSKLLFTTATNIPLLNSAQLDPLISTFRPHNARLFALASFVGEGTPEHDAYSRALTHLFMADRHSRTGSYYKSNFILSTNIHSRSPENPLSTVTSSLACVAVTYLANAEGDETDFAQRQLRFFAHAIRSINVHAHSNPASAVGMVAWTMVARMQRARMLRGESLEYSDMFIRPLTDDVTRKVLTWDWITALDMTKRAYHALWADENQHVAMQYIAHAINGYSSEDESAHQVVLSLLSCASALVTYYKHHPGTPQLIEALGTLFTRDEHRTVGEETMEDDQRWEAAIGGGLSLMKSIFDRGPSESLVAFPINVAIAHVLRSSDTMESITRYLETLLRRSRPDHLCLPGMRFPLFLQILRCNAYEKLRREDYIVDFIKTAALLPSECFFSEAIGPEISEELHRWVSQEANPVQINIRHPYRVLLN